MSTTKIEIVPYKSDWSNDFQSIASTLRRCLGAVAKRIDHIGSTSVKDLAAKDRIDIQVTIDSAPQFATVKDCLEKIGYTEAPYLKDHIPPFGPYDESEWEKRFYRAPEGIRAMNLHVRVNGRANQIYALLFRDYLRANAHAAQAYAQTKMQLAVYHSNDIGAYCDIKDPVCDLIMIAAQEWAKTIGWQLSASDV